MKAFALLLFSIVLLFAGGVGGWYAAGRRDLPPSLAKLVPPSATDWVAKDGDAQARMETFFKAELARLTKGERPDAAIIREWCTKDLAGLVAREEARGEAYASGFKTAKGDPALVEKPPFADSGYFANVTLEGTMAVKVSRPIRRDGRLVVPVAFTSTEGGTTHDQGSQNIIVEWESGTWRIADIEFEGGSSLTSLLQRPRYMDVP